MGDDAAIMCLLRSSRRPFSLLWRFVSGGAGQPPLVLDLGACVARRGLAAAAPTAPSAPFASLVDALINGDRTALSYLKNPRNEPTGIIPSM